MHQAGLRVLTAYHGEVVGFRGLRSRATIDRTQAELPERVGDLDFSVVGRVIIELSPDELDTEPTAGEVIRDMAGRAYRIQRTTFTGISYQCLCEPSK